MRRRLTHVSDESDVVALRDAHDALLGGVTQVPRAEVARRRPSLTHDGTAVVYSHELADESPGRPFRILTEPGGTAITVAQQIDWSLHLVDMLLGVLGWRAAAADLNAIASVVFPEDPSVVNAWWGGIWLGLAGGPGRVELRVYMNLRHDAPGARWQRVADVLALFGDERLESPLREVVDRAGPHGTPVGLGVAIVDGCVPVLRLYVGVHRPGRAVLRALLPERFGDEGSLVDSLDGIFTGLAGVFGSQSVTVGYDFRRDTDGVFVPDIARVKFDVSCQFLSSADGAAVLSRLAGLPDWSAWRAPALSRFTEDLTTCFGGFELEYVSMSMGTRPMTGTVYAKPHGCRDL